ncbi:HNH endonuclease [Gilliamella sp. B2911]|uniref:HNH endonuclease n=1 Tax=Gilliamella sp. B2911 TaxID=2817980 RepID=UPI002269D817|nr:HNH endonuclease [Gilliamella sp. B2911]MCX8662519.1 HNH endonuclease [Gilliamella sp. B2911]
MTVTNTVDFTGHADLFPTTGNQKNIVTIQLTGRRSSDFTQAYKEAGISAKDAKDYTWHHVADFDPTTGKFTMQLVKTQTHIDSYPHKGSAGQFADHFGVKYDSKEAVEISKKQGWHPTCK